MADQNDNRVTVEVRVRVGVDPLDLPSMFAAIQGEPAVGMHLVNNVLDKCHVERGQFRGISLVIEGLENQGND